MLSRLILPFFASVLATGMLFFIQRNPDAIDAGHGGIVISMSSSPLDREQWLMTGFVALIVFAFLFIFPRR